MPDAPSKPSITKTSDTSVETRWNYYGTIVVTSFTVQYRDVTSVDGWVTASNVIPPNRRIYEVQGLTKGRDSRVIDSDVAWREVRSIGLKLWCF